MAREELEVEEGIPIPTKPYHGYNNFKIQKRNYCLKGYRAVLLVHPHHSKKETRDPLIMTLSLPPLPVFFLSLGIYYLEHFLPMK